MKNLRLFSILLIALVVGSVPAFAQDGPPPDGAPQDERADGRRPNLLAELGLTREQLQQIRRINLERRPAMMQGQRRMRIANGELDAAIYRDSVGDEEFQTRLKELQAAQADLVRLRFESELAVRRILTSEQLVRFRELRRKFAEERQEEMRDRRRQRPDGRGMPPLDDRPLRRPPLNE